MTAARSTVSPRQVAEALGVSESSVKRWSDQGLMATQKTAGGHRKLVLADVLRFVHEQGFAIDKPELLGLPGAAPRRTIPLDESRGNLLVALTAGDAAAISRIVVGLFVGGLPLTELFDGVLAPALRDLGAGWVHGTVRVFEEHRAVVLVQRALHDLRDLVPRSARRKPPLGVFATVSGDPYTIAVSMAELTVLGLGWAATNLGANMPAHTLCEAIVGTKPRVLGLGINHVADLDAFAAEYLPVTACAREHRTAIVVGGAGTTPEVRARIRYAACCTSMRELADFCASLD